MPDTQYKRVIFGGKKDHATKREKLAGNNAAIVNLDPGDDIIKGATEALKDKYKSPVETEDEVDLGKITGNIVLSAHGTPGTLKSGRVIGSHLAGKTPEQLVDMLVKQGLGQGYSGRLDLSGRFTASGGPAAAEKDKTYAEKVLGILRKKGFAEISVEAWPGTMCTNRKDGKDSVGTSQKRGDEGVSVNQQDKAGMDVQDEMNSIRANIKKISDAFDKTSKSFPDDRPTDAGPAQDDWDAKNGQLIKLDEKWNEYLGKLEKLNKSEAAKTFAHYKGVFGLRKI
jgi:hypothetical protein